MAQMCYTRAEQSSPPFWQEPEHGQLWLLSVFWETMHTPTRPTSIPPCSHGCDLQLHPPATIAITRLQHKTAPCAKKQVLYSQNLPKAVRCFILDYGRSASRHIPRQIARETYNHLAVHRDTGAKIVAHRNFSLIDYFNRRAKDWQPLLTFQGSTQDEWARWREEAFPRYIELLGEFPHPVDLAPEVIYAIEEDGLIRERIVFDSEEFMSVPCVLLRPANMPADGRGRAILCSHGHGPFGKEPVAGNATTPQLRDDIAMHHYNYGQEMARRGYLTLCPDLRVFGERSDGGNPYPGRDKCNVHFIRGMVLGIYTLTLNIWDMMRCIDYLQTRPEIDPQRIGMMGLSQGGTMTTFTAAAESRIKAADIIGYVNPWERFGINRANFCGSQVVPGIFKWFGKNG